jgi:hypothetical protein
MMLRYILTILSIVALVVGFDAAVLRAQTAEDHHAAGMVNGSLPFAFVANRGQVVDTRGEPRPDVLYTAESNNARVFVRGSAISYVFDRVEKLADVVDGRSGVTVNESEEAPFGVVEQYRMDLELIGANERVRVVEEHQVPGRRNYYLGHAPDGILGVPAFQKITLQSVYPKIDMVLSTTDGGMKVDFIVHPGGRPSDIRMRYVDSRGVRLNGDGSVTATTPLGELTESAPVSFQTIGGSERRVATHFRQDGDIIAFAIDHYDATRTLVIDPVRRWATYYGGSNNELLLGGDPTEVDRGGNAIITGYVDGNNFPATTGAHQTTYANGSDAIAVKFNGNGVLQWATYYGGSQQDLAHGVVSDTSLNVYIAGHTLSNNFPVQNAAQNAYNNRRDAFVVKFDKFGARQWATYYGGAYLDDGYGFAADSSGSVSVLITSQSSGMHTNGMTAKPSGTPSGFGDDDTKNDVLIAKFSQLGALQWATYFGGSNNDFAYAVGTDTSQSIIITGWTYSTDLPMLNAAQTTNGGNGDAFVARYNKNGTRLWSTYYGGSARENDDAASGALGFVGVATDLAGNIFIGGVTGGSFPVTAGAMQATFGGVRDGYIIKFNATGAVQWATYWGSTGDEVGSGVAAKPDGSVLLTGWTASTTLTMTNCNICFNSGQRDAYIVRVNRDGVREFSDYYGGTSNDEGHGISFDPYGSMVVAGNTWSTNFPVMNAAQFGKGGGSTANADAFVVLFCDPIKPMVDSSGPVRFCPGDSVVLEGFDGYAEYKWNDANLSTNRRLVVKETGNYVLWAKGLNGCAEYSDTIKVRVHTKIKPRIAPAGPIKLCLPDSVILDPGAGYASYTWQPGGETSRTLKVMAAGTYRVFTIDANGCADTSDPVIVTASPKPIIPTITPAGPHVICDGDALTLTAAGDPSHTYRWSNNRTGQSMTPTTTGRYKVTVTTPQGCVATSQEVDVTVYPKPVPIIYPQGPTILCEGDSVLLTSSNGFTTYRWSNGATTPNIMVKESGVYTLTVTDDKGCVGTVDIQITVLPRPKPRVSVLGPSTVCEGDSVMLDAGDGFVTYQWSTGESSRIIAAKDSGAYWVIVTAGANCPGYSDTVQINIRSAPRVDLTGPVVVCQNTTATYAVPASPGRTYTWSVNGTGASITSGAGTESVVVKWGSTGTASVTIRVVDIATGCAKDTTLRVFIGNSLQPSISAAKTRLCPGDSVVLDAGSGYSLYRWNDGSSSRTKTVRAGGRYTVYVENAAGCKGEGEITITVAPTPAPTIQAIGSTALCPGDTVRLTTGEFPKYLWSNGARTREIIVTRPGTYLVTVTDATGCQGASQEIVVTENPIPQPLIDGPNSVCTNARGTYCATGDAGSEFDWVVTGGTIVSGQGTRCVEVQWGAGATGRVGLAIRAAATGCRGVAPDLTVTVSSTLMPTVSAEEGSTDLCAGDSVTLAAPSGYTSYTWSNGSTDRTIRVGAAGTYTVTVTGAGGCSGSGEITVTQRPPVVPLLTVRGRLEFCDGDSVIIEGPNRMASYRWSTGDTTASIIVRTSGAYFLTVTDDYGCTGESDLVSVLVYPLPAQPTITRIGDELEASLATTYQWLIDGVAIPGATQRRYRPTAVGVHTVRVTNEFGCEALSLPAEGAGASAVISAPKISAVPGERVSVPISLKTSQNLDAVFANEFTATLRFNRTLLFPTGATPEGVVIGNDRIISFTGIRPAGMTQGPLATLDFIAALGDTTVSALELDSLVWLDAAVQTGLESGMLTITSQGGWRLYLPGGRLRIMPPMPNPAMGRAVITYETIEPGMTDLALFDVLGKRVLELEHRDIAPGVYNVEVNTDPLPGGTYFIVLATPTGRIVVPMQIAH